MFWATPTRAVGCKLMDGMIGRGVTAQHIVDDGKGQIQAVFARRKNGRGRFNQVARVGLFSHVTGHGIHVRFVDGDPQIAQVFE